MRRKWRKAKPKEEKSFVANERIRALEVFLINEEGVQVGVLTREEALAMADEVGLDLVEVNPKANPPIVKIVDLGQLKYEQEKKSQKQRVQQKKVEVKGLRLSVRISQHDLELRLNQGVKFLEKGNKLKVELVLKGRERQHPEKAEETIRGFVNSLKGLKGNEATIELMEEQPLTRQGGRFIIVLANKKQPL